MTTERKPLVVLGPGRARPARRRIAEAYADLAYWMGSVTIAAIVVLALGTLALWLQP